MPTPLRAPEKYKTRPPHKAGVTATGAEYGVEGLGMAVEGRRRIGEGHNTPMDCFVTMFLAMTVSSQKTC